MARPRRTVLVDPARCLQATCGAREAMTIVGDRVSVSVTVGVAPQQAFDAFTQQIDMWWRKGVGYRASGARGGVIAMEGRPGGRLFEEWADSGGMHAHEAGRITIWEPPHRLAFEWR